MYIFICVLECVCISLSRNWTFAVKKVLKRLINVSGFKFENKAFKLIP